MFFWANLCIVPLLDCTHCHVTFEVLSWGFLQQSCRYVMMLFIDAWSIYYFMHFGLQPRSRLSVSTEKHWHHEFAAFLGWSLWRFQVHMEWKSGLQTGTKASFAVDRFSHFLKNLNMPVVCIAAVKRGGGSHWIWPQCPVHCARRRVFLLLS